MSSNWLLHPCLINSLQVGKVGTSPRLTWGVPNLGAEELKMATFPCAHMWTAGLHHPYHYRGPQR